MTKCPICSNKFDTRGLAPHIRLKHGKAAFDKWQCPVPTVRDYSNGNSKHAPLPFVAAPARAPKPATGRILFSPAIVEYKAAQQKLNEARAALQAEQTELEHRLEAIKTILSPLSGGIKRRVTQMVA